MVERPAGILAAQNLGVRLVFRQGGDHFCFRDGSGAHGKADCPVGARNRHHGRHG